MYYLLRRIICALAALLVVITATFLFMHAIPGGPFQRDKALPEAIKKNIEARYKLDQPLHLQYADYLSHLARGDLGPSYRYRGQGVNEIIKSRFPVSAQLGGVALLIELLLGVSPVSWRPCIVTDLLITCRLFHTRAAVPSFIAGTLLIYYLSSRWGLLPAARWGSPKQVIMPALALAGMPAATIARLTRDRLLEVFDQDYIKTAVAKGLTRRRIIWVHAFKNAVLPVVTYLGPLAAGILSGTFVVENIFAVPGLGKHFVTGICNRDYTLVLGVTVFYCVLLIFANLLVDLLYPLLDPRIQPGPAGKERA